MAVCGMCGERIMWIKTAASDGKSGMPLNAVPNPNGNCWIIGPPKARRVMVASADNPVPDGVRRYRAHFLDCAPYKAKKDLERRLKAAIAAKASEETP